MRDLGETLGCGAHVAELRRLWVVPFRTPRMFTTAELEATATPDETALDACLLPIETGMTGLPGVRLDADQAQRLGKGQRSWVHPEQFALIQDRLSPSAADATTVAVYDTRGRALGLGALSADGAACATHVHLGRAIGNSDVKPCSDWHPGATMACFPV